MTKVGEPEDIAGLVAFLLSKNGRYLHGSLIDADGGATNGYPVANFGGLLTMELPPLFGPESLAMHFPVAQ